MLFGGSCFNGFFFILGDNVDCWMEIQHGKGPWAPPVSGIVPLGSTLTLVVAINDYRGCFSKCFLISSANFLCFVFFKENLT